MTADPRWLSPEQRVEMREHPGFVEALMLLAHAEYMDELVGKQAEDGDLLEAINAADYLKEERGRLSDEIARLREELAEVTRVVLRGYIDAD
jgi:hypothetical protein